MFHVLAVPSVANSICTRFEVLTNFLHRRKNLLSSFSAAGIAAILDMALANLSPVSVSGIETDRFETAFIVV